MHAQVWPISKAPSPQSLKDRFIGFRITLAISATSPCSATGAVNRHTKTSNKLILFWIQPDRANSVRSQNPLTLCQTYLPIDEATKKIRTITPVFFSRNVRLGDARATSFGLMVFGARRWTECVIAYCSTRGPRPFLLLIFALRTRAQHVTWNGNKNHFSDIPV